MKLFSSLEKLAWWVPMMFQSVTDTISKVQSGNFLFVSSVIATLASFWISFFDMTPCSVLIAYETIEFRDHITISQCFFNLNSSR